MVRRCLCLCCVAVGLSLAGCAEQQPACRLQGEVRFAGKPVDNGAVRFVPISGTKGPGGGASITRGKYEVPLESGLRPGTYQVQIIATRPTGRTIKKPEVLEAGEAGTAPEVEQYIPEVYNVNSSLTVTVQAGDNPPANFDLAGPP